MEILQTIWNVLTNENEVALIVTGIPMFFIEALTAFLLFTTLLNITYTKKQALIYIISLSTVAMFTTYFVPNPYNTFINLMAMPVLIYFIFKTNALKAIVAEITTYILLFIIVTPLITIYTVLTGATSSDVAIIPIHKLVYSIILYILMFLVYKLLKKFNIHITFLDKFDTCSYNILIINFIVGIVSIAIQAYTQYLYIDYIPSFLILLSLVVLLIYFFISLYSLYRTNQLEKTKQLLEEEKMYNQTLNTLHENIRGFKHDFHNIVQALGGYISSNNMEGLKAYYKDMFGDCQINNNLTALNPELINNPAIYGLLVDKYYKAEALNIEFKVEVFIDLSNLNIKMYELTRILGILLDNAVEAASKCDKKQINVIFRKDNKRNKDLIIIQNTYINKDVNIDRIFEKGYTSKEDNEDNKSHGLGLWEVRKYLKKNTDLDLYTTKTDELFSQQFEIYNL